MRPVLTDAGILVRPFAPDDVALLHAAVRESIDTVGRWMSWCHPDYSVREAEEWIARCGRNWEAEADREFGIFAKLHEVLGCAGINQINCVNNFANLGYWVRASRVGRGVASVAVLNRLVSNRCDDPVRIYQQGGLTCDDGLFYRVRQIQSARADEPVRRRRCLH